MERSPLMKMSASLVASVALFSLLASRPSAEGALITGTISGTVTSTGGAVAGVAVGSLVVGSYTYDDSTTYNSLGGPSNPLTAFSLTIGTNPRTFSLADLISTGTSAPGRVLGFSTAAADALLFFFSPPVLSDFLGAGVGTQRIKNAPPQTFDVSSDGAHAIAFAFTATPSGTVPEPSTAVLLGLGCALLVGCGAGRRRLAA